MLTDIEPRTYESVRPVSLVALGLGEQALMMGAITAPSGC